MQRFSALSSSSTALSHGAHHPTHSQDTHDGVWATDVLCVSQTSCVGDSLADSGKGHDCLFEAQSLNYDYENGVLVEWKAFV